jgi:hypothetical protein
MNTGTQTLYHRDGHEQTFSLDKIARMASCGQVGAGREWSSVKPPPQGWEREVPRFRVTRDLQPAPRERYRFEPPFGTDFGSDRWQYGDREYAAGAELESKCWPHESMLPLNYSAERVLSFFKSEMKSRLPTSPWFNDQVRLDNGMSGPIIPDVRPPQMRPTDLRPV